MLLRKIAVVLIVASTLCFGSTAEAQNLDKPILTVSGKIPGSVPVQLSLKALLKLPQHELVTRTPWHNGKVHFAGVRLSDLVEHLKAEGENAEFVALNDYRSRLPVSDFKDHSPLLAFKKDGEFMTIRDKGPLFVIYPYDDKPELKTEVFYSRSVWQVRSIEFR